MLFQNGGAAGEPGRGGKIASEKHCTQCGAAIPVAHSELSPLLEHFQQTYGFAATPGSLTFDGLCAACLQSEHGSDATPVDLQP